MKRFFIVMLLALVLAVTTGAQNEQHENTINGKNVYRNGTLVEQHVATTRGFDVVYANGGPYPVSAASKLIGRGDSGAGGAAGDRPWAQTFDVTVQFSVANASNTLTMESAILTKLLGS